MSNIQKKHKLFIYIFLSLFLAVSSMFFTACGAKYDKMKMLVTIYGSDGYETDSINLILDDEDSPYSTSRISVNFTGINKKYVGKISVTSEPMGLLDIGEIRYDASACAFDITAKYATNGSLTIIHNATGRSKTIDVLVGRKANGLSVKNSTYAISIPKADEGVKEHIIYWQDIIRLDPDGAIDGVYYLANENAFTNSNIEPIYVEDTRYIKGFKVPSNAVAKDIELTPVLYVDGYEEKTFENSKIKFSFVKRIDAEDVTCTIPTEDVRNKSINEILNESTNSNPIILIKGDKNYGNLPITVAGYTETKFYQLQTISESPNTISSTLAPNNVVAIQANAATEGAVKVDISLVPTGCVGDLKTITKSIYVKGETAPAGVKMYDAQNNEMGDVVDIADYYTKNNGYGELFRFGLNDTECFKDFRWTNLVLPNGILNAKYNDGASAIGINPVYSDIDLTTESNNGSYRDNRYLLQIYKGNYPLKFYYDKANEKLVSEKLSQSDRVYIKFVENAGSTKTLALTATVQSINLTDVEYLKDYNLSGVKKEISFSREIAVTSLTLSAGLIEKSDDAYTMEAARRLEDGALYINRKDEIGENFYALTIQNGDILGVNGQTSSANFRVEVIPKQDSQSSVQIGRYISGETTRYYNRITYNYSYSASPLFQNAIILKFKEANTGVYEIKFTQISEHGQDLGIEYSVNIYLYQEIKEEDITLSISGDKLIDNNTALFSGYECNYIIPKGETVNFNLSLPVDSLVVNIVKGYSLGDVYSVTKTGMATFGTLTFNEANVDTYITMEWTITARSFTFADGEKTDGTTVTKSVKFFVYESLEEKGIALSVSSPIVYKKTSTDLKYFTDIDSTTIKLTNRDGTAFETEILNYVQNFDGTTFGVSWIDDVKIKWSISGANIDDFSNKNFVSDNTQLNLAIKNDADSTYFIVYAQINQFGNNYDAYYRIEVRDEYLTETMEVGGNLFYDDFGAYLELRPGDEFVISANQLNTNGEVTNKGVKALIIDGSGNKQTTTYAILTEEDGVTKSIKIRNDVTVAGRLQLLIYATDALVVDLDAAINGFNNPRNYLFEDDDHDCQNAYKLINLYITTGTTANPFLIKNTDDFWEMAYNNDLKDKHFRLMTDIDLENTVYSKDNFKAIGNFSGSIISNEGKIFTISNVTIPVLFEKFNGKLTNINFTYKLDNQTISLTSETTYIGLVNIVGEDGKLTNVSVTINPSVTLTLVGGNSSSTLYFGALAGQNKGTITYDQLVGSDVYYQINGTTTATVYAGGLVGYNLGTITGVNEPGESVKGVVLSGATGASGSLVKVGIESSLSKATIGGVVGKNENTTIDQVSVTGTIKSAGTTGGIVGENKDDNSNSVTIASDSVTINFGHKSVSNSKSSVVIESGGYNVGGVVGLDTKGGYYYNQYQILKAEGFASSLKGNNNVGGIAGQTTNGTFEYCSVMSYTEKYGDNEIVGNNNVGGLVGYSKSSATGTNPNTTYNSITAVVSSSVTAKLVSTGNDVTSLVTHAENFSVADKVVAYANIKSPVGENKGEKGSDGSCGTDFVNSVKSINGIGSSEGSTNVFGQDGDIYYVLGEEGEHIYELAPTSVSVTSTADPLVLTYYEFGLDPTDANYDALYNALNNNYNKISLMFEGSDDLWNTEVEANKLYYFDKESGVKTYITFDAGTNKYALTQNGVGEQKDTLERDPDTTYFYRDYDFSWLPASLKGVRLLVSSERSSVISVNERAELELRGVGDTKLIFTSAVNPEVKAELPISVERGLGERMEIIDGTTREIVNNKTLGIAKGSAKEFIPNLVGEKNFSSKDYNYITEEQIDLQVTISANFDSNFVKQTFNTLPEDFATNHTNYFYCYEGNYFKCTSTDTNKATYYTLYSIAEIFNITGDKSEDVISDGKISTTYIIPYGTKFVVSVRERIDNVEFDVKVKCAKKGTTDFGGVDAEHTVEFKLKTAAGPSAISINHDSAILYPNSRTVITARITTDIELNQSMIEGLIAKNYADVTINATSKSYEKGIQTVEYKLIIPNSWKNSQEVIVLNITFDYLGITFARASFTVLPQAIDQIEIRNYLVHDGIYELKNVLKPTSADGTSVNHGQMIISIAPNNGYYDYLELKDITGDEEIIFTTTDASGVALSTIDTPTADGKGIRIDDSSKQLDGNYYIKTLIDKGYSSKTHTVQVRAYLKDGRLLHTNTIYIEVKMLPSITVEYLKNNNEVYKTINTAGEQTEMSQYIAAGTTTRFNILANNSDTVIPEYTLGETGHVSSNYRLNIGPTGVATIDYVGTDECLGETLTISLTARATASNGDFETAELNLNFTIVKSVIFGVSLTHTTDGEPNVISGHLNTDTTLDFYFRDSDYNARYSLPDELQDILRDSNSDKYKYLELANADEKVTLSNGTLLVQSNYLDTTKLVATLPLKLGTGNNANKFVICTGSDENVITLSQDFSLNFIDRTSLFDLKLIKNETEFLNMASGEDNYYILGKDLEFTNYTPVDKQVAMFDGNGHTITIKSFKTSTEDEIKMGVFKQVYDGMAVMNLRVKYDGGNDSTKLGQVQKQANDYYVRYKDITVDTSITTPDYTGAKFGGITSTNNGVITNCLVTGQIALRASVIETKLTSGKINFNIGGIVCDNTETGYITNSYSELRIFAGANIGGVAHNNAGTIASCGFDAQDGEHGCLYSFIPDLETLLDAEIGGFVVGNSGKISLSYVEVGETTLSGSNTLGNISSRNSIAGFIYDNSGDVTDCYSFISKIGLTQSLSSGFVLNGGGNISRSYSYINGGGSNEFISMFVPNGVQGNFTNCLQVVNSAVGLAETIEGLTSISTENARNKSYFDEQNFVFGDDENGIWKFDTDAIKPILVSTTNRVNYLSTAPSSTGRIYYGLRTITVTQEKDDETGTTIEKAITSDNTYGIKENPYIIYDLTTFNAYFGGDYVIYDSWLNETVANGYYRFVRDIDFGGTTPITASTAFSGYLDGNNMILSNYLLYTLERTESIGLFKSIYNRESAITHYVRNLDLQVNTISATRTIAVGSLAGIIDSFDVYNIRVSAQDNLVGGNTVGGLAGIIRGKFDVEGIYSTVGAYATRDTTSSNYAIYLSKNNKDNSGRTFEVSSNLTDVYYAGGVAGILDGYNNTNVPSTRSTYMKDYYRVRHISVTGQWSIVGDSVGSAFGLVGERTYVDYVFVETASGELVGAQVAGGVAGENRGIIANAIVKAQDNLFERCHYTTGGIVGLNIGGLIKNTHAEFTRLDYTMYSVAGGIVGKNIDGLVIDSSVDVEIIAQYAGGIIGGNYSAQNLKAKTSGIGVIKSYCAPAIVSANYTGSLTNLAGCEISVDTIKFWTEHISSFYTLDAGGQNKDEAVEFKPKPNRLIGIYIAGNTTVSVTLPTIDSVSKEELNNETESKIFKDKDNYFYKISGLESGTRSVYQIKIDEITNNVVLYLVGQQLSSVDGWDRGGYNSGNDMAILIGSFEE